jgi:hypothetical protein
MSSEPRHGPVTMHRAIERKMLRDITKRPADAPRPVADDGDAGNLGARSGAGATALRGLPGQRDPDAGTDGTRPGAVRPAGSKHVAKRRGRRS